MHLEVDRKDGSNNFIRVLFFDAIEYCKLMSGFKSLPFFDLVIDDAKKIGKDMIEACYRTGEIRVSNFSFAKISLAQKFPAGDFKFNFRFFDDIDDNVFNMTMYVLKTVQN